MGSKNSSSDAAKPLLLQATKFGTGKDALEVQNRVFMAPLTRGRAQVDHVPTKRMVEYYGQRSAAGLIISEATGISQQGMGWFQAPGIWTDEQVEAWKPVVKAAQSRGAKFYIQLWHMGRQGHSDVFRARPVSASEVPMNAPVTAANHEKKEPEIPHALTIEEIKETVKDYGKAARNAKAAGFDGVQIHGANGYLIDQFNQPCTNKRTDDYGGSIENRLRFMREIVEEVLTVFPKERVSIRISPNGSFAEMGSPDNNETFAEAIKFLASKHLGFIEVMDGLDWGYHKLSEPFTAKMGRDLIREVQKSEGIVTALVCNVGYTKKTAEELIQESLAEEDPVNVAVAFGRPFISNPDLVERFEKDQELSPPAPYPAWWGSDSEEGYTDFPTYDEIAKAKAAVDAK